MAKAAAVTAPVEERVPLYIPPARDNEEETAFISINGVNYRIPKGKEVMVPRFVRDEYERAVRAERDYRAFRQRKIAESKFA